MLDYELKRMVNNDIEYCKKEWDNYSFDWERMGRLFDKMIHKYINVIDGFDKDLKVISAYEKKNNSGDTYRDNLRLIISRLEAFRDNGYKNEGLLKENSKGFNIRPYDRTEFDSVRLIMDRCEKIGKKEKEEISQKLDEIEIAEDSLQIDGVLEVTLLYLTSDDAAPVQAFQTQLPFHCAAEARGIREDSVYQLDAGLEQLGAVMMGGGMVEIKAVITLDFLVLQPVTEPVVVGASVKPIDLKKLQELPGIVGYIVQPGESLWSVAKKFHTTVGNIITANELADDQAKAGQRLLLVKEIAQE